MLINDPWYKEIEDLFGLDFALRAGYFQEDKPFHFSYADKFELPKNKVVIQMSGAFHPFHEGHLEIAMSAYHELSKKCKNIVLVLHEDHSSYKNSKGIYTKENDYSLVKSKMKTYVVSESSVPDNCSRNFTRLYSELSMNNDVYFLCGGDRANFSLSFLHKGNCIVSGREESENFKRYKNVKGVTFLNGNNEMSSSYIRCNT